jgi:hypothetical protein
MTYFRHDAQNVLYNNYDSSPLVADSYSSEIDFYRDGGCHSCEAVFNIGDIETGEAITFTAYSYSYATSTWSATAYKIAVTENGEYVLPLDNRMIPGGKLKFAHDVVLDTDTLDGLKVHAHVRPRTL